ncbi:MAG: hypothetical protein AB8G23_05805 [Myxococcota bacterium]
MRVQGKSIGTGLFCDRGFAFVLAAALLVQGASSQAAPAVDGPSLRWFGGYDFGFTAGETSSFGGFGTVAFPEIKTHAFGSGLLLTMPLHPRIGVRLGLAGGGQVSEFDYEFPFFGAANGDEIWGWDVTTGADVFARNPEVGFVELGYRYRYASFDSNPGFEEQRQIGTLAAGLYLGSSALLADGGQPRKRWRSPTIDLETRFTYSRILLERRGFDSTSPEYSIEALAHVYLGERVRFGLGGRYAYEDVNSIDDFWSRDVRGLLRLLWLIPVGGSQSLTLGLRASGGEIREKGFFGSFDRAVASAGFEIGVLYPGGDSLVRLLRERF